MPTPRRLHPDHALEAAAYIRVSQAIQAEGYSPEVQRAALERLAAQQGYLLTMTEEDHERGSKITRRGYQAILDAVRAGTIHAVLVFMFDRFGRDGGEWITRARELERLGVPLISAQEGKDEPGIIRFVRAGMAEQFSRDLAKRMKRAMEQAARAGVHLGPAPYGYKRVYQAREEYGRQPPGRLAPDPATSWVVGEIFSRYAAGGYSLVTLAGWLNTDPRVPPPPRGGPWTSGTLRDMLKRPVYLGHTRYNHRPSGLYERSGPGEAFRVEGTHEAIITPEVWDAVQARLAGAATSPAYNHTAPRKGRPVTLLAGLLRCAGCGGPLYAVPRTYGTGAPRGPLVCANRVTGRIACRTPQMPVRLAEEAILREVGRLSGAPWTEEAARRLLQSETAAAGRDAVAARETALAAERERLRRHIRSYADEEGELSGEEEAAYREVRSEIAARIRSLEAGLAGVTTRRRRLPGLQALHARLSSDTVSLGDQVRALYDAGASDELRALLRVLIARAREVERRAGRRKASWVRMEVTWTPDVQALLDAGLLALEPLPPSPPLLTAQEAKREEGRRYRARRRAREKAAREQAGEPETGGG